MLNGSGWIQLDNSVIDAPIIYPSSSSKVCKIIGDRFGPGGRPLLENLPQVADPSLFLDSQFVEYGTGWWKGLKYGQNTTDCIGK